MSETTFNTTAPAVTEAKVKRSFSDLAFVQKFNEFKRELWIALSIHTNRVTKFNSLATAVFILTGLHLLSLIIGVSFGYMKSTILMTPLQVFSVATQFYVLSYLFPIVHHMMKFYQKKRIRRFKAEWKAKQKAHKAAYKAAETAREAANGSYNI